LELLDGYNHKLRAGGTAAKLASPSPEACKWCPYQMLCPAFWEAGDDSWAKPIGAASVGGEALAPPRLIHGGAALVLSLSADEGTGPLGAVDLAPLNPKIHTSLAQVQAGTRVRATGLARRADGTVIPVVRTVIARSEDLPAIVVSSATPFTGAQGTAG
jgi:hypothetical protein